MSETISEKNPCNRCNPWQVFGCAGASRHKAGYLQAPDLERQPPVSLSCATHPATRGGEGLRYIVIIFRANSGNKEGAAGTGWLSQCARMAQQPLPVQVRQNRLRRLQP